MSASAQTLVEDVVGPVLSEPASAAMLVEMYGDDAVVIVPDAACDDNSSGEMVAQPLNAWARKRRRRPKARVSDKVRVKKQSASEHGKTQDCVFFKTAFILNLT